MYRSSIIAVSPWDQIDNPKGKPGVPEAAAYGLIFVVFCLLIVLHNRRK